MAKVSRSDKAIWLGEIPEEWKIERISALYSPRNTKVSDEKYPPLSVTMGGVLPQLENVAKTDDHSNRKLVRKGDFAINSRSDRRGSCGISQYDGSVSLINTVLRPNDKMNPIYYDWLFHTEQFADEFYKWGHGIVDDLWSTNWQDMKNIWVVVPPLDEQKMIGDFLDERCAKIDKLSEDIKKQIEILEEYKKSVITRAVTKGLEPNVEMKDSGLVWIRGIPSHWRLSRLKYMLSKNDGGVWGDDPRDSNECEVVLRSTEQTIDGKWSIEEPALRDLSSISYLDRYQICGDDLLITKSSGSHAHIGKTTLATKDDGVIGMYYSNFLQRLHTNKDLNSKYLWYLLNIDLSREQFVFMQNSTSGIGNINAENINNLTIPIPTNEEQIRIIDFLDGRCGEIDISISKKREQFKVLLDYKKSIVYEYVTGKKRIA